MVFSEEMRMYVCMCHCDMWVLSFCKQGEMIVITVNLYILLYF